MASGVKGALRRAAPALDPGCQLKHHRIHPLEIQERLFFALKSVIAELESKTHGSTMKHVVRGDFEGTLIPLPEIHEQQRIVDLLSRAGGIVRLRRQAQQKVAALIPAIFVDMFGDPATNPKGWPKLSLGTMTTEFRYGTSQKSGEEGYPTLRIPNVIGDALDPSDMKLVDVPKAEADRIRLVDGDLLFVRTNGNPDYVGRSAVFAKRVVERAGFDGENCLYASYLIRARLDQRTVDPTFLQAFLSSAEGRKRIRAEARTSAGQYNINTQGLASVVVPLPPLDLQASFVRRCQQFMGLAELQATATQKAEESFQALLAHAFSATGQVPHGNAHEEALA
ncbi:MAG: restriction endonuclease subunit S [Betaproteobacteria bacterium]